MPKSLKILSLLSACVCLYMISSNLLKVSNAESYEVNPKHVSNPPQKGEQVDIADTVTSKSKLQALKKKGIISEGDFVVWSSNRYGNHDIVKMDLSTMLISRLTEHEHSESYPRISPDGTKLVFMRAQFPWLSWRNNTHWDVVLLDLKTNKETIIRKGGFQPTWDKNGIDVYYVAKAGTQIEKYNVNRKRKEVVFATGQGSWHQGMALYTPSYNEDLGNFALNFRKPLPNAGFLELNEGQSMVIADEHACQTAWSPNNDFAYYVGRGGIMKRAFYKYDYGLKQAKLWFDMPKPFSYEYFPMLSQNQNVLTFGASKGGKEHDTEDYEIFIWKVGTDHDSAIRLSFHSGNDNWPDIYINK